MLYKEIKTLFHQPVDLQEVSWYQYSHCIFNIQFRTVVLLNGWFFGIILATFLQVKLPSASPTDAVEYLVALLLLFEFFHWEDVVQKPFEYDGVTMNGDINLILIWDLLQALVKVLHVLNQQTPAKCEVSFFIFAVIDDVNHYAVLEVGSLNVLQQTWNLPGCTGILCCRSIDDIIFSAVDGSIIVGCTHMNVNNLLKLKLSIKPYYII